MPSQAGDWTWMSTVTRRDNRVTREALKGACARKLRISPIKWRYLRSVSELSGFSDLGGEIYPRYCHLSISTTPPLPSTT